MFGANRKNIAKLGDIWGVKNQASDSERTSQKLPMEPIYMFQAIRLYRMQNVKFKNMYNFNIVSENKTVIK